MSMRTKQQITEQTFVAYLDCTYKASLQIRGCKGKVAEYEQHTARLEADYQASAIRWLEDKFGQQGALLQDVSIEA